MAGVDPTTAFVAILGTTALVNKRYIADGFILSSAAGRWLAMAGWLVALTLALAVLRRRPGSVVAGVAAGVGGLAVLGGALALGRAVPAWGCVPQQLSTIFVMMLLVWIPLILALWCQVRADRLPPWPRRAHGLLAVGVLATLIVVSRLGPMRTLLLDFRYDKLNWCLLTFGWLYLGTRLPSLVLLGRGETNDGLGAGRWRFWLPWTLAMLVFMVVLIVLYAGGQSQFTSFYPMFRGEWPNWSPVRDGYGFLVAFEIAQGCYFLAWEYFFRGWMLFRLEPLCGPNAILWQTIPFVLMHLGKPGPELHSSLIAGLVLGWLALRSRSFWPCFLLHWSAACTMDLVAVWHLAQRVH
ncbi:MAG: CPBP family intramembrane metalloprotease [Armatimonadetes bacterium]|nr:CPBP family intramembrane metalloprotease [Armatimonadota bacterium]